MEVKIEQQSQGLSQKTAVNTDRFAEILVQRITILSEDERQQATIREIQGLNGELLENFRTGDWLNETTTAIKRLGELLPKGLDYNPLPPHMRSVFPPIKTVFEAK